jgi:group II intron reverse transcriptase/maturase
MLDSKILELFTEEKFKEQFLLYKHNKTDIYRKNVIIPMGVDGVDWESFEKTIDYTSKHVCKRVENGTYFFSPFRELEVPKPPYTNLKDAQQAGKTRTLSIATIKDVIFQKIFYLAIENHCERKFNNLGSNVNFAYRRGKSAPMAVGKLYNFISDENYVYALDGDLQKFFDEIDHELLFQKLVNFFGIENSLTITYLKRFYSADKVSYSDYNGNVDKYYSKKPKRVKREKGIPQGGVLSGLIANIFLYDFDCFVVNDLYERYGGQIKYIRYADDFVILFKNKGDIRSVYQDIGKYLEREKLILHEIGDKTKVVDMSKEEKQKLEFLGYEISPKGVTVKKDNISKFKRKIAEKVNQTKIYKDAPEKGLEILINRVNFKIQGNLGFEQSEKCPVCGHQLPKRNWLSYFLSITDVRTLRNLDIWIRKQIYSAYYFKTKQRLSKNELVNYNLPSLEKMYYKYKKDLKNDIKYCECNNLFVDELHIE